MDAHEESDAVVARTAPLRWFSHELVGPFMVDVVRALPADARLFCAMVCREWRDALASDANRAQCWRVLDVSPSAGLTVYAGAGFTRAAARAASGALRELNVSGCAELLRGAHARRQLEALLREHAPTLRVLRATRAALPTAGAPDAAEAGAWRLTPAAVARLLDAAPGLEELHADLAADPDAPEEELVQLAPVLRGEVAPLRVRSLRVRANAGLLRTVAACAPSHGVAELVVTDLDPRDAPACAALTALAQRAASPLRALTLLDVTTRGAGREGADAEACALLAQLLGAGSRLHALTVRGTASPLLGRVGTVPGPVAALCAAVRAGGFLELSLCNVGLFASPPAAAALLRALSGHSRLAALAVRGNDAAGGEAAIGEALGALLAADAPALTSLDVGGCRLRDAGLAPLFAALRGRNRHLRALRCDDSVLTAAFARDALLPAVVACASLRALWVAEPAEPARRAETLVARRAALGRAHDGAEEARFAAQGYPVYGVLRSFADFAGDHRQLGAGSFGSVVRALDSASGAPVALKVLATTGHARRGLGATVAREVSILQTLRGAPHVVALLGVVLCPRGGVRIALELAAGGTLEGALKPQQPLPFALAASYARQLAAALACCHAHRVLHRDVKPANLLLFPPPPHSAAPPTLKLADFGLARRAPAHVYAGGLAAAMPWSPGTVTLWYRAPEVLVGVPYGPAVDVWSLGCVVAEMALGRPLFPGQGEADTLGRITHLCGSLPGAPWQQPWCLSPFLQSCRGCHFPPRLLDFIARLLTVDPAARLSAAQAAAHDHCRGGALPAAAAAARDDPAPAWETCYLSAAQLEASPSRHDGMLVGEEEARRHAVAQIVHDLAMRVGTPAPWCVPAAQLYLLRYYAQRSHARADSGAPYAVATAALLLASKALGQALLHVGDLVRHLHSMGRNGRQEAPSEARLEALRAEVTRAEWNLALALGFDVNVHTPDECIRDAAQRWDAKSDAEKGPIIDGALRLCNAASATGLPLRFDDVTLAACLLALGARMAVAGRVPPAAPALELAGASALVGLPRAPHEEVLDEVLRALLQQLQVHARDAVVLSCLSGMPLDTAQVLCGRHAEAESAPGAPGGVITPPYDGPVHTPPFSANSPAFWTPRAYLGDPQ